ncbi:MAG: hypothetical protein A2Y33_08590 [Spirochaetes bacterium GWF1_51_8]|nr:MAG: hypothetical protein A2Y33_08590 [Spirochaetes bacterium GWF1_51_8]
MKRKLFFTAAVFTAIILSSCGIEAPEPIRDVKPPLALSVTTVSNKIRIEFWAYNDEPYITGYWVYVSDTRDNLLADKGQKYQNTDGVQNKPTIWRDIITMTEAVKIVYFIDREVDSTELENGLDYFFMIKAYSYEYNLLSKPSNITNVTFIKL